jgi:hypothetical protein
MDAEAMSLAKLLARYDKYTVPHFQRVYGWTDPQIRQLLGDFEAGMQRRASVYLGNIYLAISPDGSEAQIADGQQRFATLNIICATGRDLEDDPAEAERLHALLACPRSQGDTDAYRFAPRDIDAPFFRKWVQEPGATRLHPAEGSGDGAEGDGGGAVLSESQANIIGNRDMIASWLEDLGQQGRRDFFRFLQSSARVAVLMADSLDEARNAHASTHSRGLAQAEVDKLKAELLGDCAEEVRARLAGTWEEWEARLGKEPLAELLQCLVFIESERKPQHSLEADLAKVFDLPANVETFIEKRLVPAAEAYERILKSGTGKGGLKQATAEGRRARRIDGHLATLMRTTHDTWKGPAVLALTKLRGKALETFLHDLERLAAVLMIVGVDPNRVVPRYAEAMRALKSKVPPHGSPLIQIEAGLLAKARGFLGDPRFGSRDRERYRMPMLLKLNDLLHGSAMAIDPRRVSCEHILPRNAWRTQWSRRFRNSKGGYIGREYVDRLGNLAILSHRDNCDADTKPYEVKRRILKASGFALSKDAAKEKEWTPKVVEARTGRLLELLIEYWRLK